MEKSPFTNVKGNYLNVLKMVKLHKSSKHLPNTDLSVLVANPVGWVTKWYYLNSTLHVSKEKNNV